MEKSTPGSRTFLVLYGLLTAVLLTEVLFGVMVGWLSGSGHVFRASLPVVTAFGIILYSRFVRYAGGALLLSMGLFTVWAVVQGPSKVGVLLTAIIVVGSLSQTLAGASLLFWRAFASEFDWQRQKAPPWVAKLRLGLFLIIGVVAAVAALADLSLVLEPDPKLS